MLVYFLQYYAVKRLLFDSIIEDCQSYGYSDIPIF